mmetsp:Transcript_70197/g.159359  ORF Transcript_70197/g.159359 Transcript_70197/m.159359 type:complete len:259 (+) Transcript_70197:691-1467(+)
MLGAKTVSVGVHKEGDLCPLEHVVACLHVVLVKIDAPTVLRCLQVVDGLLRPDPADVSLPPEEPADDPLGHDPFPNSLVGCRWGRWGAALLEINDDAGALCLGLGLQGDGLHRDVALDGTPAVLGALAVGFADDARKLRLLDGLDDAALAIALAGLLRARRTAAVHCPETGIVHVDKEVDHALHGDLATIHVFHADVDLAAPLARRGMLDGLAGLDPPVFALPLDELAGDPLLRDALAVAGGSRHGRGCGPPGFGSGA